jgi:hypothetical protein
MPLTRSHLADLRALQETLRQQLKDGRCVRRDYVGLCRRSFTPSPRKELEDLLAACEREIERLDEH